MKLNVQTYLRSGKTFSDLESEFGIKSSEYGNLVVLNYNQIESPKTHPIVRECRQLVLEKGTWNVIFQSFNRFFNYGEALDVVQDFDYSRAIALEKIDGSILGLFFYNDKWHMTTRGVIEGDCQVGAFPITFKQLFEMTVAQYPNFWIFLELCRLEFRQDYCYTFELTSPENRVVTPYSDRALHLLTVRDRNNDFQELEMKETDCIAVSLGVKRPAYHCFSNISELTRMAAEAGQLNEGFVCTTTYRKNGDFQRIKVKNPSYLAIAHLKESSASSLRSLLYLVVIGEAQEFLSYFPEYRRYIDELQNEWVKYRDALVRDFQNAKSKMYLERKDYALWVKDNCVNPSAMFLFKDGRIGGLKDWIDSSVNAKGAKSFGKMMMDILKIKDIEWKEQ